MNELRLMIFGYIKKIKVLIPRPSFKAFSNIRGYRHRCSPQLIL